MAASSCTAFIPYLQVEVKYNDHIGSITKKDGSAGRPSSSGRSRPAAVERFADDLVTITLIPYKIVEGGGRPSSKDWRKTA
jgi:hypothetical protein